MKQLLKTKWFWTLVVAWVFSSILVVCPYFCLNAQAVTSSHACCPENELGSQPSNDDQDTHACCQKSLNAIKTIASSNISFHADLNKLLPVVSVNFFALTDHLPIQLNFLSLKHKKIPKFPAYLSKTVLLI